MQLPKPLRSVTVRLAFRFTLVLTASVIFLSAAIVAVMHFQVRSRQNNEVKQAEKLIESSLQHNRENDLRVPELPYFITFLIYSEKKDSVVSTNDPFLPVLPETNGKTKYHFSKNYFLDGDLSILYFTKKVPTKTDSYIIQTSLNMDQDTNFSMLRQLPQAIGIALFPTLIITFFVALFICRLTLSPVSKITQEAKQISSTNLDTLLSRSHSGDELDQLAKTFNELFRQLKKDFDRERQFTSDVSHELKTPVAVVLGQANMLRRWGKDDPELLTKSLNTIIDESKSMEAVITNLLQMGRLESGRVKPQMEEVDILEMFKRVEEETILLKPETVFEYDKKTSGKVVADKELLHQVFMVSISNSLKFVPENLKITLKCEVYDKRHHMCIEDNGPGFPPESLEHVFERFYRADTAHTRSVGGSGLGLAIAKTILTAMHGQISAYNASPCGAGIKISL